MHPKHWTNISDLILLTPYKAGAVSTHPVSQMRKLRPTNIRNVPKKVRVGLGLS